MHGRILKGLMLFIRFIGCGKILDRCGATSKRRNRELRGPNGTLSLPTTGGPHLSEEGDRE